MTCPPSDTTPQALDVRPLARSGAPLSGQVALQELPRWRDGAPDWPADAAETIAPVLAWALRAEYRVLPGGREQLWLHLDLSGWVPQVCQRCLTVYLQPIEVDRWFRFVADEATADAQDDDCEEDLLVWTPRFPVRDWLEDELLLALPLVPMHDTCPQALPFEPDAYLAAAEKPHPFAALSALKADGSSAQPKGGAGGA